MNKTKIKAIQLQINDTLPDGRRVISIALTSATRLFVIFNNDTREEYFVDESLEVYRA